MPVFAKLNNHVDKHQTHDVNHSVLELLFNMFASSKAVKPMDLMFNKLNQAHAKVLMDHNH
jgi:hypothetical protein